MTDSAWSPRIALITGAGSGIGRQLALKLAADGVAIAGVDVKADGVQALQDELRNRGQKMAWRLADVTQAAALNDAVGSLETELGPVDLLIASAGLGYQTPAAQWDAQAFNAIINVNLIGVANSIAAVLPGMLQRGRGHLVALSSMASYRGLPMMGAYCASKSGVNAMMEAVRFELRGRGIITTTVCPSWIRTPMTAKLHLKVPMLEVDDAAARIVLAIRRRKPFVAFPGGPRRQLTFLNCLPRPLADWFLGRMFRSSQER